MSAVRITREIVAGAFQSAYLSDYGMSNFGRQGFMSQAVRSAKSPNGEWQPFLIQAGYSCL